MYVFGHAKAEASMRGLFLVMSLFVAKANWPNMTFPQQTPRNLGNFDLRCTGVVSHINKYFISCV